MSQPRVIEPRVHDLQALVEQVDKSYRVVAVLRTHSRRQLKRCRVSSSACLDLTTALIANKHLRRMDLSGEGLGLPGKNLFCEGLRHPTCRLQMVQLRACQLEVGACQEIASVLSTSRRRVELDLTGNALEDSGLRLSCQGLWHPVCRLRILWGRRCEPWSGKIPHAAEQLSLRELQLPKPSHLEPVLRNKRSHRKEKPAHAHRNEE
ncbi:NACHT, LRR and PYD domains-containing protein 12 [Kogia breviceps]|uniref:NACHT, LRR and PYD domains-containing protein 12 n=1 Tax=Kogia breviceps TaxID=27615 RepID=UPI0034D375A2